MVVDFEICKHQAAGRLVESERLLVSENTAVEVTSGGQIIRFEANMGDAHDRWPLLGKTCDDSQDQSEKKMPHVATSTTIRGPGSNAWRSARLRHALRIDWLGGRRPPGLPSTESAAGGGAATLCGETGNDA